MRVAEPYFESIPAYEQVKIYVVSKLTEIARIYSDIQQFMFIGKYPEHSIAFFKSEVMAFYVFIRPKMIDFIKVDREYSKLIDYSDCFIGQPSKLKYSDAVRIWVGINQFCEEYRLTSTTIYHGTSTDDEGTF